MPRYIAFLRAINVGGHNVKMAQLRTLFEELEYTNVETFIASGNVIFDTPASNVQQIEQQIERHLQPALGYPVATFIRSDAELAAVASYQPFTPVELWRRAARCMLRFSALRRLLQQRKSCWRCAPRSTTFTSMSANSTGCAAYE